MIYACVSVISKTSLVSLGIFSQASETVYVSIFFVGRPADPCLNLFPNRPLGFLFCVNGGLRQGRTCRPPPYLITDCRSQGRQMTDTDIQTVPADVCRGLHMSVHNRQVMQAPVCCRQVLQTFQTDSHTSQASEHHRLVLQMSCSSAVAVWSTGVPACYPVSQSECPPSCLSASSLFVLPICLACVSPGN